MTIPEYITVRDQIEAEIAEKKAQIKKLKQKLSELHIAINKMNIREAEKFLLAHNIQCPNEFQCEVKKLQLSDTGSIKVHWQLIHKDTKEPVKWMDPFCSFLSGYLEHIGDGYTWVPKEEEEEDK